MQSKATRDFSLNLGSEKLPDLSPTSLRTLSFFQSYLVLISSHPPLFVVVFLASFLSRTPPPPAAVAFKL